MRLPPDANDWLAKAIEADDKNCRVFLLGKDYALLADMLRRVGDAARAGEKLAMAIEIFGNCRADVWVRLREEALARL